MSKSPVKVKVGEVKKEEPLEEGACPHCHKKHIDLQGDKKKFEFQGKGNKNCNLTCVKIIKKFGIIPEGAEHTLNRTFKETTIKNGKKNVKNIYINDTTTDHYVVIIGRDCDKGKVRYIFWDVGSDDGGKEWYFEKQEDGSLIAPKAHNSKTYTVTQIRRNKKEVIKEIKNEKTNKTKYEIITY
ncbi:hypothetical protein [Capnocytophaga sp. G2]|uniref:hypothetical protein n=1 Tax=Capnocytophaga sp. G2 TaxID=3110695 RepID=UPI002B4A6E7C|nr:hypothetical protein [Capnocytophaga sp. G2]MEB3005963.1 hypothetical protein [Capnocytophaga sp. G2]